MSECVVCYDLVKDKLNKLVICKNKHIVCKTCIKNLMAINKNYYYRCPYCRELVQYKNDKRRLVINEDGNVSAILYIVKYRDHPQYSLYDDLEKLYNSFALEYIRYLFENSDQADAEVYTAINKILLEYMYATHHTYSYA